MGNWCSAARGGTILCQQSTDSGQMAECDRMIEQVYQRHWTLERRGGGDPRNQASVTDDGDERMDLDD